MYFCWKNTTLYLLSRVLGMVFTLKIIIQKRRLARNNSTRRVMFVKLFPPLPKLIVKPNTGVWIKNKSARLTIDGILISYNIIIFSPLIFCRQIFPQRDPKIYNVGRMRRGQIKKKIHFDFYYIIFSLEKPSTMNV